MTVLTTIPIPPLGGFTVDDLADYDLPRHAQLIRGGLYVNASSQTWRNLLAHRLANVIDDATDGEAVVLLDMALRLDERHAPEPDIMAVKRSAIRADANSYPPGAVILAVEIMSQDQRKDRIIRPEEYALAGIPHYWRIERTPESNLIGYTYELDPVNLKYEPTGVHHDRLRHDQPWSIDCVLRELATP